jgi:mannose-1-phosphate guanylyltransferase / mannose-6-phosphate isomerase
MNSPAARAITAATPTIDIDRRAIVLAGGSGTRLWPLSRATMPKQLLALNGRESLLQDTMRRLLPMVESRHVTTVTHADHRFEVAGQLHAIDPDLADHVLAEPIGRNTLPAIAWATARIAKDHPAAIIGVFSSDHAVADAPTFHAAWLAAEQAARQNYIALFGMQPTEPATGFGYIQAGDEISGVAAGQHRARKVTRFVEKPDAATAIKLLAQGNHYWNGGMFVFRAETFLQLLRQLQPAIFDAAVALSESGAPLAMEDIYKPLPDLSVDYGILEHSDKIAVVPVTMGWSDLGSWEAIYQQRDKDEAGNMIEGDVLALQSNNNLFWSAGSTIAALGVDNLAVVQTRDATLVCPRDKVADLKHLVNEVKARHPHLTETHLTVARPWGSYTILEEGPYYKIKRIVVKPGQKLSMQMHYHRSEHWVVIAGTAKITNGDQEIFLEENESTYIPKTNRHRLENPGKIPLQIIEIQTGAYLEEDDIVRFGDIYGRANP